MSGILAALRIHRQIGITTTTFPVGKLLAAQRIELAIQALAGAANVRHLAAENEVSGKFVYRQKTEARDALEDASSQTDDDDDDDDDDLFYLPVTKAWMNQVALSLTLICLSSYRDVVEFMRDSLGVSISAGGVHHLHQLAARLGRCRCQLDRLQFARRRGSRCSAMVESFNSRLRNYFTLRRQLGGDYLSLLQFFLNHRTFLRSRVAEQVGKSPKQLMTGQARAHWLTRLGFGLPPPLRA